MMEEREMTVADRAPMMMGDDRKIWMGGKLENGEREQ